MSESIFKHLVDSINRDYENTYAYLDKNFSFIRKFIKKIAAHIGCNVGEDIYIIDEKGVRIHPLDFIQDAIFVEKECFFSFKLAICPQKIGYFNGNACGKSFSSKGLVPPSIIVMPISIKQEDDAFIVIAPSIKEEKIGTDSFKINSDDSSWTKLLESVAQLIKNVSKQDLKYRISRLSEESSQQSKTFGFSFTSQTDIVEP